MAGFLKKVLAIALVATLLVSDISPISVDFVRAQELSEEVTASSAAVEVDSEGEVSVENTESQQTEGETPDEGLVQEGAEQFLGESSDDNLAEQGFDQDSEHGDEQGQNTEDQKLEEVDSQESGGNIENTQDTEETDEVSGNNMNTDTAEENLADNKDTAEEVSNNQEETESVSENSVSENSVSENTVSANDLDQSVSSNELTILEPVTVNGVTITVSGAKTSFAEGTTVQVVEVDPVEEVIESVEEMEDGWVKRYKAFDITLHHQGQEVQPLNEEEITVKFEGDFLAAKEKEEVVVYHVDDNNEIEKMPLETSEENGAAVEMETTHFSTFMVAVMGEKGEIEVTINHYLGEEAKEENKLFLSDTVYVDKGGSIEAFKKGGKSFTVNKISVDNTRIETTEKIVIDTTNNKSTVDIYYQNKTGDMDAKVTMYDYGEGDSSNPNSINYTANYNENSEPGERIGTIQAKNNYELKRVINGKEVNVNGWLGSEQNNIVVEGLLAGLEGDNYSIVKFNDCSDPGFFSADQKYGKKIYSTYSLQFKKTGFEHTLVSVSEEEPEKEKVVVVKGLDIKNSNNFYPLNNKNNGNVNFYFGMRYDVSFRIGDYVGPMTYTFSGDDDLWVCLDGKVVLDLGGIHGAIEKTVDLWEVLLAKKNPTYDDKKEFLESNNENIKEKKRTHTITVLYMERGAYKSNCYMSFILPEPESSPIETTPAPTMDVAITKKNNLTNKYIEGIEFTLYRSSTCQEEDKITNKKSNKEGNVIFNGLREGEYYIKETDFVDIYGNSYKENNTVYKLKITKDDHGNLQQSLFNLIEGKEESVDNNIIYNTPENGTLKIQKTVDSVDNIDKYASFTFKIESSKEKNNSRKNVVLYKTIVFNSQGTKTVIVKNLPFGEYTVTELSTINYKCTKPVVTKALKVNKEVVFEFNNEFNSSGGFFDTNVVVNKISIQDTVEGTDGQVKKKYNLEKILGDNSLVTNNE